jgi:cysteinyl-tRNA synthetase
MVEGEKMSKSLGNFITFKELFDEGVEGVLIRLVFLQTHYRKPLDFTKKSLEEARNVLIKFYEDIHDFEDRSGKIKVGNVPEEILEALKDDLNTPKAIAILHNLRENKKFGELKNALDFLGLYDENFLKKIKKAEKDLSGLQISEEYVLEKIELRDEAKGKKNWAEADRIRDDLKNKGIVLKDSKDGTEWSVEK